MEISADKRIKMIAYLVENQINDMSTEDLESHVTDMLWEKLEKCDVNELVAMYEKTYYSKIENINFEEKDKAKEENDVYRVVVACKNANGDPDFYFCKIKANEDQYNLGYHYDEAESRAMEEEYEEPFMAFDEKDPAGRAIMDHFAWETASVFEVRGIDHDASP